MLLGVALKFLGRILGAEWSRSQLNCLKSACVDSCFTSRISQQDRIVLSSVPYAGTLLAPPELSCRVSESEACAKREFRSTGRAADHSRRSSQKENCADVTQGQKRTRHRCGQ